MLKHTLVIALLLLPTTLFAQSTQPLSSPAHPAPLAENKTKRAAAEVARLENQLKSVTKEADPQKWASLQAQLGDWLTYFPTDNRQGDLLKSIAACQNALSVLTPQSDRQLWVQTHICLVSSLMAVKPTDNAQEILNNKNAIQTSERLLTVITRDQDPNDWRETYEKLGLLWTSSAKLNPQQARECLLQSIAAQEATFTAITSPDSLDQRASIMADIAQTWMLIPYNNDAQRTENLKNAILAWSVALSILPNNTPFDQRASYQILSGDCWQLMPANNDIQTRKNLLVAAAAYQKVIDADPKGDHPKLHFDAIMRITRLRLKIPAQTTNEKILSLQAEISLLESALSAFPEDSRPHHRAVLHYLLAFDLDALMDLPGQDTNSLLKRAIAYGKAAIITMAAQNNPEMFPKIADLTKKHKKIYEAAGLDKQIPFNDIPPAQ